MGKIKLKDLFNRDNIKNFIEGTWNKIKDHSEFLSLDRYIREQAVYRAYLCKECYDNGSCLECGCDTPGMFYAPKKEDSLGRWGEMLTEDEWDKFKENNSIEDTDLDFEKIKEDDPTMPDWLKEIYKTKYASKR